MVIIRTPMIAVFIYLFAVLCTGSETKNKVHIVYLGGKSPHEDPKTITDSHHEMLASVIGSKEKASELMVYSYKHGFSGFAAKLTKLQAERLAELSGVIRVIPNTLHKLLTTRSWDYLGLSAHSPTNLLHGSKMGDGVIIGVLDTGVWPESKAFNDEGLGPIPSKWKGVCESGQQFNSSHCNRKIIGARWYVDGLLAEYGHPLNTSGKPEFMSPRDASGHGTHTASTAGGSFVGNVSYKGLGPGTVRGGAPRARLAIYKVCWNLLGGQCSAADILKAFDDAIRDGVDVLSVSIGSAIPLFSDVDERDGIATGSFHAVANGITVVCGASNDGPSAQTVQNTAPWILTVAASTIDRSFLTPIRLGNNKTFMGQAMYTGKEIAYASLVYPESDELDLSDAGVCEHLKLDHTMVKGKVVLCFTLSASRAAKANASATVRAAGGVGVIVSKNPNDVLLPCTDDFPCIEVDYEVGTRILYYIRSTRSPVVKLSSSKTYLGKHVLSKVAYFSSRGPNSIAPAILKPDITAPGVNIIAASSPLNRWADDGYAMFSGTSMSTPHVAGIVALLKSIHPDWPPAAIKSALVTTAWRNSPAGFPIYAEGSPRKVANPFDVGGGIVNANSAANPGLVYDMRTKDYIHYLCAMSYNTSSISKLTGKPTMCPVKQPSIFNVNLPSITLPNLQNSTTLTRRVTNVGPRHSIYKAVIEAPIGTVVSVKPNVLVFDSTAKTLSFTVTISSTYLGNTDYSFGNLIWTDGKHIVKSPLTVRIQAIQPYIDEY